MLPPPLIAWACRAAVVVGGEAGGSGALAAAAHQHTVLGKGLDQAYPVRLRQSYRLGHHTPALYNGISLGRQSPIK
jgi:hypothetical protein